MFGIARQREHGCKYLGIALEEVPMDSIEDILDLAAVRGYEQETYRRTCPYLKSHIAIGEVETFMLLPTDALLIGSILGLL